MIDDELAARVLQLYQVENLSIRQIADYCCMCRKTVSRLIRTDGKLPPRSATDGQLGQRDHSGLPLRRGRRRLSSSRCCSSSS